MSKTTTLNKQDTNIFYTGSWSGLSGVTSTGIENISNEDQGSGSFGDYKQLSNTVDAFIEGTDYDYDDRLDSSTGGVDIYDDEISGAFASGKHFRVVENSKNITDVTHDSGGLKVYAKNLISIISPPEDRIYVDPQKGKVVLPRPIYWSKCNSDANLSSEAEIISPTLGTPVIQKSGSKLNIYSTTPNNPFNPDNQIAWRYFEPCDGHLKIYPFGTSFVPITDGLEKGTISFWHMQWSYGYTYFFEMPGSNGFQIAYTWGNVYSGGSNLGAISQDVTYDNWGHWYIVWDKDGIGGGSLTIKVYKNGILDMFSTSSIEALLGVPFAFGQKGDGSNYCLRDLDNVKIWQDAIDDPSWEYNSGNGREAALHKIYGSGNGYKPNNLDVGYRYITPSNDPATLTEANASGAKIEWILHRGIIMRNIKFSGIKFRKDDESGIAKINITDTTTSTGIITDALIDLYTADQDYTLGEYEPFVYWTTLDPADHEYLVVVEHSGIHNPSAGGSYHIQIDAYLITEELNTAVIETIIIAWHSDHSIPSVEYTLTPDSNHEAYKLIYFSGDSSTGSFVFDPLLYRASAPYRFSVDSGVTWLYPNSYQLTWGSTLTSTGYVDELVDSEGMYGVTFDVPPDTESNNVIFSYIPKVDKYIIETTLKQPNDGIDFKDLRANVRLLDHGIEVI